VVIDNDNDHERGEFAAVLNASPWAAVFGRGGYPTRWWAENGATTTAVMSAWQFENRESLERVLRLEFPEPLATGWLADHPDRSGLSYGYLLHTWRETGVRGLRAGPPLT